jgi:ATP-dependent DNA helicase UvrD/PcrA
MTLDLTANLNPAQKKAVTHLGSPLMIIAGAGSGKTRVITHRIAFLNRECGIPINQIMAVTFTNKAAREMRERVCRLLGIPDSFNIPIGTFHSRCALILRREAELLNLDKNFVILDEKDQQQAIKRVLKEMEIGDKRVRPSAIQSFINQAKMKLLTPEDCAAEFDEDDLPYPAIYKRYQEIIEKSKSIDFEDLLMKTVQLFQKHEEVRKHWGNRYQYLLVDEYQDTNHAQFLLTKLLAQDHRQICIVGDEDQSIYSWRGAEISNLLDFEKAFPGTELVKLELNYRSTGNILKAASTVIDRNTQRIGKVLYTEGEDGELLSFISSCNQEEESNYIARECLRLIRDGVDPFQIAVFYRGHWLSRGVEDSLRKLRLPYRILGGVRFYDRAEVKDILCYLRLAVNPHNDLAFERVVNRPTRGIGAKSLGNIVEKAAASGLSLYEASRELLSEGKIRGKAKDGLSTFLDYTDAWNEKVGGAKPGQILNRILEDTDYKTLGIGDPESIDGASRLENIEEFEGLVSEFKPSVEQNKLGEFLVALALDGTEEQNESEAKVSLMTIHNAKGLEYDYVFTVGMEKGVFPTGRAEESFEEYAIEEERRLFYVAITRTRKKLYLMYSQKRNRPDFWGMTQPSMFLSELPPEVFDESSISKLSRLLPYNWGKITNSLGGKSKTSGAADGELQYVLDEEGHSGPPKASPPRRFGPSARGGGFNRSGRGGSKYHQGQRVEHKYMGPGTITQIGGRTGWERAMIEFDDGRSQEFVLKYAPLTIVG